LPASQTLNANQSLSNTQSVNLTKILHSAHNLINNIVYRYFLIQDLLILHGEKVFIEVLSQNQSNNTINLTGQLSGVYFYRIIANSGELIRDGKLIIQK
jgi:hypothetical protein